MPMLRTRRAVATAAKTTARTAKEATPTPTPQPTEPEAPEVSAPEPAITEEAEDAKMEVESTNEAPASTSGVTLRRKSTTPVAAPPPPLKEPEPEPEPQTVSEPEPAIIAETTDSTTDSIEMKSPDKDSVAESTDSKPEEPVETPVEPTPTASTTETEVTEPVPVSEAVPAEAKPSTSQEKPKDSEARSILPDSNYLINVALGYGPADNLKQPLKGFTAEDEVSLFPIIDSMSSKLFTIVQKMTDIQKKDIERAIKLKKGILKLSDFPKVFLCQMRLLEPPSEADKSKSSKRAPHPFLLTEDENIFSEDKLKQLRAVLDAGWKREVVMRSPGSTGRKTGDVYYYSPDGTKYRSSKQVAQHLAETTDSPFTIDNFSFAKVRISTNPDQEIVRKAYDGKSPPRAQSKPASPKAKPPQPSKSDTSKIGAKASTSKDINDGDSRSVTEEPVKGLSSRRSIQPPKRYSGDAVLLLSKRSKIQDDKRGSNSNKGLMQMGMLPPKYPKGMEDSSSNLSEGMDYNDQGSNQEDPSGGNSMAMKEIAEDSLFQISALRQSGGIDVDHMQKYVEHQKKMAQKNVDQATAGDADGATTTRPKKQERIPCSIRCPGMTGEIPNLQCSICLCLFHAECLGLPPNLTYNNFVCQNCRDLKARQTAFQKKDVDASPTTSAAPSTIHLSPPRGEENNGNEETRGDLVKRSPPPLIRATSLHQGGLPRRELMVTASRDSSNPSRLPQKVVVPSSVVMARGMGRGRGMSASLMRSPVTVVHRSSDGSSPNMTVIRPWRPPTRLRHRERGRGGRRTATRGAAPV
ncbi:Immunoglobulin A1 protease autotransporter [Orchesella cincta]|uniref:Immunoglobulin A1 protease autotransporter n=1 Tax=Orchesella cincta TaxID=48709 RepID=A0A1D2N0D3_ORCCI|nr:Immunoglobulin A1 protease autotransporter [Orchesella cincta]